MPGFQETFRGVVYPWQCDHIGHLNVQHYVAMYDSATWHLLAAIGITPEYLRREHRGMAAVHQAITYRRELLPGDLVTVRSRLLEIGERKLRFEHVMEEGNGEVASTCEIVGVHLDTTTRRAAAFPTEVQAAALRLIETG